MVVGEMPEGVDLLVIGGGPGGYFAALAAAQRGRKVVLVDALGDDGLGGACVRVGCIPSKALIEIAAHTDRAAAWAERGVPVVSDGQVDLARFQSWKNDVVDGLSSGVRSLLAREGVDVRRGWFRFTRPDQGALVTDPERPPTHLRFASCVIATGSRPVELGPLPFDGIRVVSSTEVLALAELPAAVAIIGGGYIGLELGTALAKLGSNVTIIEARDSVLPEMSRAASDAVAARLEKSGVEVLTRTTALEDDGAVLRVQGPEGRRELHVDLVVVAVGRTPNTDDLGLAALGVDPGPDGRLTVGADLLITERVAAIGDIVPGPALAHKASAEAQVAVAVLSGDRAEFAPAVIPAVVFSDPEVAQAGLTTESAAAAGYTASAAVFPFAASGRARTMGADSGFIEYVIDDETGILIGATIVGDHASELIAEAVLAIEMAAHLEDIAGTIHVHPTLSEMHAEVAHVGLGRPIHVPAARGRDRGGAR